MTALDTTIVNVARDTLAEGVRQLGDRRCRGCWSAYSIVFAAVLLTSGRLADRYGRRRIYTTGLLVFISASALCGAAPTLEMLIAARMVQAIGAALLVPAALALLLPEYPAEKRSTALGIFVSINSLAAAAGPVIGGMLIDGASWRAAFFVNVPIGLTAFVLGRRVLVESRDEHAVGIPDPLSIATGIGSVGLWPWSSRKATTGATAAPAAWPGDRCRRTDPAGTATRQLRLRVVPAGLRGGGGRPVDASRISAAAQTFATGERHGG